MTSNNGSQSWADGDIISSAADLNRFFRALLGGRLLPPRQLAAMKTTVATFPEAPGFRYGLGLTSDRTGCGVELWGHGGGWMGSHTMAASTEDGRHSLAFNLNADWYPQGLGSVIEAEFCGTEPTGGAMSAGDARAGVVPPLD